MDYNNEVKELEPDVFELLKRIHDGASYSGVQTASLVSIAISLKRIADEICGVPYDYTPGADNSRHCAGLVDGVATAIEQAIIGAARTR